MSIHEKNKLTLLHLFLIEGVGAASLFRLIKNFSEYAVDGKSQRDDDSFSFFDLYQASVADLQKLGMAEKTALAIVQGLKDEKLLADEIALIEKHGTQLLTLFDQEYPSLLRQIALPPLLLYCQGGKLEKEAKRIGFVGSRLADEYAQSVIEQLIPPLVARQWEIVSGGASGADTMAHQATVQVGGKTTVVLGSGLLQLYPTNNIPLFKAIVDSGSTLLSCFPMKTPPEKHNFPVRNRIIAGLSYGCVVVQAAVKSGALITAEYALDEGRQLFAVPGSVHHTLSRGCHDLIAHGAKLVNNANDIFEEFGELLEVIQKPGTQIPQREVQKTFVNLLVKPAQQDLPMVNDKHYSFLMLLESVSSLDELSCSTGLSLAELNDLLFQLQLEGKVRQNFTGSWERVI